MKHEILYKPSYSLAVISLDRGEDITAEAGAMVSMSPSIQIETKMRGGLLGGLARKFMGGESFFLNTFRAEEPGEVTLALWGILIFMAGVYLGGLTTLTSESFGVQKLGKGFGLLAIIYGAVLLVGSLAGSNSILRPLAALNTGDGAELSQHGLEFRRIKTTADLDAAIILASTQGKSAMLDFYADWCVSCVEMEEYTFTDAGVQDALSNTVLLQADVTANDDEDQALLQRFGVFGPPTIIFFGADGVQRHGYEVVGYMKAKDFAEHVRMATGNNSTISAQNQSQ